MKPKNTEKRAAVRSVVISTLLQLLAAGAMLCLRPTVQMDWLKALLLILAAGNLVTIPFNFTVLRQRLREIEKGELDEARKY